MQSSQQQLPMRRTIYLKQNKADFRSVSKNAVVLMCGIMKLGLKREMKTR